MIERLCVPESLADEPPGPALATALAAIDLSRVNGHDLITVLRAQARQIAHEQARLLAIVAEVAHCPWGHQDSPVARTDSPQEFAADEIRAALTLTRRAADGLFADAMSLCRRIPAVHAALAAGRIDLAKARVIHDVTLSVDDDIARAAIDQVLPDAPGLTTGQLAGRLRTLLISIDPHAAARRQQHAVNERHVWHQLAPDGTASIAGHGLPPDRAAAAFERLDAIAKASRHSGDERTLAQLRADTFLDLLEGRHTAEPTARRSVVELTVPLETLLQLSHQPGQLAGWGPVVADVARQIVDQQRDGTWRWTVRDSLGRVLHHGTTRRRPLTDTAERVRARDRTCRGPGCRVPARHTDLDHTIDHALGGPTAADNLGALCRHDHRLKHEGGWGLEQIVEGVFRWTSALGHHYIVAPEPPAPP